LRIPQPDCDVTLSDDAHNAIFLVDHRYAPYLMPLHQFQRLLHIVLWPASEELRGHYVTGAGSLGIASRGHDP